MQPLTLSDWLRENQRTSQLNADAPILFHLNDASTKIIAELIEGRLSLCAAAQALRAVRESKPAHLRIKEDRPPRQSVEEYFVRRAFRGAELDLKDDPRRDAILARLHAELDDYLYAQAVRPCSLLDSHEGPPRTELRRSLPHNAERASVPTRFASP